MSSILLLAALTVPPFELGTCPQVSEFGNHDRMVLEYNSGKVALMKAARGFSQPYSTFTPEVEGVITRRLPFNKTPLLPSSPARNPSPPCPLLLPTQMASPPSPHARLHSPSPGAHLLPPPPTPARAHPPFSALPPYRVLLSPPPPRSSHRRSPPSPNAPRLTQQNPYPTPLPRNSHGTGGSPLLHR